MEVHHISMKVEEFMKKYLDGERDFSNIELPPKSNLKPYIKIFNRNYNPKNPIIFSQLWFMHITQVYPFTSISGTDAPLPSTTTTSGFVFSASFTPPASLLRNIFTSALDNYMGARNVFGVEP